MWWGRERATPQSALQSAVAVAGSALVLVFSLLASATLTADAAIRPHYPRAAPGVARVAAAPPGGSASDARVDRPAARVARPAAPPAVAFAPRAFETGIVFPRWSGGGVAGYSDNDGNWLLGLGEIEKQTGAGWIEMMIQLSQDSQGSTSVHAGPTTPAPASVAEGVRAAHARGFRVFIVPLLGVLHGEPWGGAVHFAAYSQQRAWFASYWHALKPYMAAAAEAGAEQFAIGTELSALELGDTGLWNTLIANAHATFPGKLTYDMNFSTLGYEPRPWMRHEALTYLGVSEYAPLASGPWRLSKEQIGRVWDAQLLPRLNALGEAAGKPVLISEIGYRNASDALYRPWDHSAHARPDPELQASAYEAALRAAYNTPGIAGIFFWAWSVEPFGPKDLPAARALRMYYDSYRAATDSAARRRHDPLDAAER
jgi:glycosyl hydrolase family 113